MSLIIGDLLRAMASSGGERKVVGVEVIPGEPMSRLSVWIVACRKVLMIEVTAAVLAQLFSAYGSVEGRRGEGLGSDGFHGEIVD